MCITRSGRHHGSEVDELGAAVRGAPDVARAHVAVDEAARVEERERRADAVEQRACLSPRQRASRAQIAAVEQLHRVERALRIHAIVVHPDDVRVRKRGERVKLALEHRLALAPALGVALRREQFQRDLPLEGRIERAVHRRHPAAPEQAAQVIAPGHDSRRLSGRFVGRGRHRTHHLSTNRRPPRAPRAHASASPRNAYRAPGRMSDRADVIEQQHRAALRPRTREIDATA